MALVIGPQVPPIMLFKSRYRPFTNYNLHGMENLDMLMGDTVVEALITPLLKVGQYKVHDQPAHL